MYSLLYYLHILAHPNTFVKHFLIGIDNDCICFVNELNESAQPIPSLSIVHYPLSIRITKQRFFIIMWKYLFTFLYL